MILLQVWLQEFAWTKSEHADKLAKRNASMALQDKPKIEKEPMFNVEAMLVCLYWSLLIYDLEEVGLKIGKSHAYATRRSVYFCACSRAIPLVKSGILCNWYHDEHPLSYSARPVKKIRVCFFGSQVLSREGHACKLNIVTQMKAAKLIAFFK